MINSKTIEIQTNPLPPSPPEERRKSPSFIKKCVAALVLVVLIVTGSGITAGVIWLNDLGIFKIKSSDLASITKWHPSDNTVVFDRTGRKIAEFFSTHHVYVAYDQIPRSVVQSIIAIEDKNFWTHHGIDIPAMFRAAVSLIRHNREFRQGASTITQQLVRNFLLTKEKTIPRKIKEIALAIKLETLISKEKIMEIYANSLFLGSGSYGVGSASLRYFGKPLSKIQPHEAPLLAGLFQLPSRYNPHKNPDLAKSRQMMVLGRLKKNGIINAQQYRNISRKDLVYKAYHSLYGEKAPYFVDFIRERTQSFLQRSMPINNMGLRIYTTLNPELQTLAERSISMNKRLFDKMERLNMPQRDRSGKLSQKRIEGAILVTSSTSGEILAMVGGRNYKTSKYNRATNSRRSPGSAFKPIVYSSALQRGKRWSDITYLSPITMPGNYRPRNLESDNLTETTLLRAFYKSINSTAVLLTEEIGISSVIRQAHKLGITGSLKSELGTSLGSSEVGMLEMAKAYSTFSNLGHRVEQIAITKITDRNGNTLYEAPSLKFRSKKVITPQISFLLTQGMRSVLKYGTGFGAVDLSQIAAGKTGTSNQSKDNWFCGYTSELTAVVWAGTDDYSSLNSKTQGASIALPIWRQFMRDAVRLKMPAPFKQPPGVLKKTVHPRYGHESASGVEMWFTQNNLPEKTSALEGLKLGGSFRNIFSR